jgi:2-oxoglutarate ferredoxin oxidoreductase subunit gamma
MTEILLAGFGGQGVLFAGKFLCCAGILEGKHVSWLPSYGPEMRGGTCHCSVIISDETIGAPVVRNPDVLIALNEPSFNRFEAAVKPGGMMIADSSMLISGIRSDRTDIKAFYPAAAQMASDNDMLGLGNLIMVGKLLAETGIFKAETIEKAMKMAVPERNEGAMTGNNLKAIALGEAL